MVKTAKKSLFGKIFKKKNKKKNQEEQKQRKVEILVEVQQVEETREDDIPRDPSAMEPPSSPVKQEQDQAPVDPQPEERDGGGEEEERDSAADIVTSDSADILADLRGEEANPTPPVEYKGFLGGWLEGMTNMCGPVDQGLPTIMSGEEMDMDLVANGESASIVSPTSTVQSEAPLSPVTPKVEEEGEVNKTEEPEETTSNMKEVPVEEEEEKKVDEAETVLAEPPQQEQAESPRPAPIDAPTTPKSLVMSPRNNAELDLAELELEEADDAPTTETPKAPGTPKDMDDNTLVASPEKEAQEVAAEPAGAKMDIFSSFTACCNPVAAPSMDETEGIKKEEAVPDAEGGPKDPDGDKDDENKSVAQEDSKSVVAGEKTDEADTSLPSTPANEKKSPEKEEPERVSGTVHKEKKNTKMGLSLKNSTMYQGVFIAKIKPGSLFSETDLREGMQVLEIQGKPCPNALEEAVSVMRHAVGDLEILAQKPKCEI